MKIVDELLAYLDQNRKHFANLVRLRNALNAAFWGTAVMDTIIAASLRTITVTVEKESLSCQRGDRLATTANYLVALTALLKSLAYHSTTMG